jgi:hypothetical protein
MADQVTSGRMPFGHPSFESFQQFLTPERIAYIKSNPERQAFVKQLSEKLARDPVFMKAVEEMLQSHGAEIQKSHVASFDLATFGWSPSPEAMPSPRAAAAAVGAAAAAMVVPVPV